MLRLRTFVFKHKTLFLSFSFLVAFSVGVSYAAPLVSPYTPGQTLDPSCAPGDTNCTVAVSSWATSGNNIYYNGSNVGIGTTTPSSKLDVEGDLTVHGTYISASTATTTTPVPAPTNLQATIQYDPSNTNGYTYVADGSHTDINYRVYTLAVINRQPYISASYATLSAPLSDDGSGNHYAVSLSWNPPSIPGASVLAYAVFPSDGGAYDMGAQASSSNLLDSDPAVFNNPFSLLQNLPSSAQVSVNVPASNGSTISGGLSVIDGISVTGPVSLGEHSIATSLDETTIGAYNVGGGNVTSWNATDPLFEIGNGADSSHLSDALEVLKNGNTTINGNLNINGTLTCNNTTCGGGFSGTGTPSFQAIGGTASGNYSVAMGSSSTATQANAVAIGVFAQAGGVQSIALGGNSTASADRSAALGYGAHATGYGATALGYLNTASGGESVALGYNATASGDSSVAIGGYAPVASALYSVAIGTQVQATSSFAVAIGDNTAATGTAATAFGAGTLASGHVSTAFGHGTTASGDYSTAFGTQTTAASLDSTALGFYNVGGGDPSNWVSTDPLFEVGNGTDPNNLSDAFSVLKNGYTGIGVAVPQAQLDIRGDGTILALGGSGTIPDGLGNGPRFSWDPSTFAFRAGFVSNGNWDSANVGSYSVGFGISSISSGTASFAGGITSIASNQGAISYGIDTNASGNASGAFNLSTTASGDESAAFGDATTASGAMSAAFGNATTASGDESTAFGGGSQAIGEYSIATGQNTVATQYDSFVGGLDSTTPGSGGYSFAFGNTVTASGNASVGFGQLNTASGDYSAAFGYHNTASGSYSASFGQSNTTSGGYSVTFGENNTASGMYSTAFGENATASSYESFVLGQNNVGGGDPSNWVGTDPLFEIGNGTSGSALSDALIVLKNGDTGIALDPTSPIPSYTLQVGSSAVNGIVARFQNSSGTCDINPTNASLSCSSDMNLKDNITNISNNSAWSYNTNITPASQSVLDKVLALNPVTYNWDTESQGASKHDGFIAQEVQEVFPDLVTTDPNTHLLSLNYTGLIPYTVEAIKEMNLNITNIDNLDTPNNWRSALLAWFGDVDNGITNFFSKTVTTDQLCVKDDNGETCLTRSQIDQVLNNQNTTANPNAPMTTTVTNNTDPAPTVDTSEGTSVSQSPEVSSDTVSTPADATDQTQ